MFTEVDAKAATRKYAAVCNGLGEVSLAVTVGNDLSCAERSEYAPTVLIERISLKCAVPKSIELAPLGYHGQLSETRELWQTVEGHAPDAVRMCTVAEHTLGVVAYMGDGRTGDRFTNASSLNVVWKDAGAPVEETWGTVTVSETAAESTVTVSAVVTSWADWVSTQAIGQLPDRLLVIYIRQSGA